MPAVILGIRNQENLYLNEDDTECEICPGVYPSLSVCFPAKTVENLYFVHR